MELYEYIGNLHIHSAYSDGSGSIDFIASTAAEAGLDFIGITDHNCLDAAAHGQYRYIAGVLVIVGEEVGGAENHYLAFDIDETVQPDNENPQRVIDSVASQGGFGIIAHPYESGSRYIMGGKIYPWTAWDVTGYQGLCVWNMLSQWRDSFTSIPSAIYYCLLNPRAAFTGPRSDTLALWDSRARYAPIFGIAGSDAHAIKFRIGPFTYTFGSYAYSFKCINTHVLCEKRLTGSHLNDSREILNAIKKGRSFFALDLLGQSSGFRTILLNGSREYEMGEESEWNGTDQLYIRVKCPEYLKPSAMRVRLLCDGALIHDSPATNPITTVAINHHDLSGASHTPKVLRVEAYKRRKIRGWRPWIYANPFRIITSAGR